MQTSKEGKTMTESNEMLVRTCGNCGNMHRDEIDVNLCYADSPRPQRRVIGHVAVQLSDGKLRQSPVYESDFKTVKTELWTASDAGMYKDPQNGGIYKVYASQQSGRILCKQLKIDKFEKKGRFEYLGMASRFIRRDWQLSLEEAQKFGKIYGVCCMCGRTLTDETSIANGIGPICAGKFNL